MHTLYTRINTGLLVFIALTGIVLVTMMATRAYGGPLDPPGPPASTMKTLQQVEPRTPIVQPGNVSEFPITISQPGSYYFTGNITGVLGKDGILINADNVTLDLNGFTLTTDERIAATVGITDNSIGRTNLIVRNGIVRDWAKGVETPSSKNSTYEDLTVTDNRGDGMTIGSGSNLRRVTARNNGNIGLRIMQIANTWGSIVEDSNFSGNGGWGIYFLANNVWVHHNIIDSNNRDGLWIPGSYAYNEITDNRITGNVGNGVVLFGNRNVVVRNVTDGNTAVGQFVDYGSGNIVGPLSPATSTNSNANIGIP